MTIMVEQEHDDAFSTQNISGILKYMLKKQEIG